jgi:predicted negative regulator of RcsB-dependent stress response
VSGYNEAEQIEQLKRWWQEYGVAAMIGVALALVLGFGWRYWQNHREQKLAHVSMRYEQLLTNVVNGNAVAVEIQANRLIERYPHTPYTQLAALQLARQYVYQNRLADAEDKLEWVMAHGDNSSLRQIARLRAARAYLADKQPNKALDLLDTTDDKAYEAVAWELKGDILAAMNKDAEARDAYHTALNKMPSLAVMQPLLKMKIDNLTGAGNAGHS